MGRGLSGWAREEGRLNRWIGGWTYRKVRVMFLVKNEEKLTFVFIPSRIIKVVQHFFTGLKLMILSEACLDRLCHAWR